MSEKNNKPKIVALIGIAFVSAILISCQSEDKSAEVSDSQAALPKVPLRDANAKGIPPVTVEAVIGTPVKSRKKGNNDSGEWEKVVIENMELLVDRDKLKCNGIEDLETEIPNDTPCELQIPAQ